jgi:hypothetical protein
LGEAATGLGSCHVRSETESPCLRPAVVEISGIPFCKRCARDQEAYFAIGELTQALTSDRACQVQSFHRGEQLIETLRRMRRDNAGRIIADKSERAASVGSLG